MVQRYEMLDDRNMPGPGEMISEFPYCEETEHMRVSIHKKNESVLKLKGDMIPYPVKQGSKQYEGYRHILQLIGASRYKHQENDLMSKSVNK